MPFIAKKLILSAALFAAANAWATGPSNSAAPAFDISGAFGNINGVTYRVHGAGGGRFAGTSANDLNDYKNTWSVSCQVDAMTDKKKCTLHRRDLVVMLESGKVVFLYVGDEHFPGKQTAIRIDDKKPHIGKQGSDGDFTGGQVRTIVQQLTKGKSVITRFYQWPEDFARDDTFELTGFNEALEYAKWASRHIK